MSFNNTTIQAILFDHDGTLVDSEIEHFRMWVDILAAYGVSLTLESYKNDYAGLPTETNAHNLVAQFDMAVTPAILMQQKNTVTREFLSASAFPLMPGARETIAYFYRRGFKLAMVTGAGSDAVNASLEAHDLTQYFDAIVSKDDVSQSKPAPECYLLALQHLGLEHSQAIALEDTEHGVQSATGAGIICLAIPNDMSKQHDFSAAHEVCISLNNARDWIDQRSDIDDKKHH